MPKESGVVVLTKDPSTQVNDQFDLNQIHCKVLSGQHNGIPQSASICLLQRHLDSAFSIQDKYNYIFLLNHYGKSSLIHRKSFKAQSGDDERVWSALD